MKKIVIILLASVVTATAFVSCQKKDVVENNENSIHFTAAPVQTKTAFTTPEGSSYPVLWTANDTKVKISMNYETAKDAEVTPSVDFRTATFDASFSAGEATSFKFFSISPASASNSFNSTYKSAYVTIPSGQTPSATSVDEAAQILCGSSTSYDAFPGSVTLSFDHVTAYGKVSFLSLGTEPGETISNITLTATKNWAGAFYYYFEDNGTQTAGDVTEHGTAPKSKSISINTTTVTDVWFACAPVDLGGTNVEAIITTSKGTFTKVFTIPSGKKFQSGKIASFAVNMSGVSRVEPETWKETPLAEITTSDVFVIVCNKNSGANHYALPNAKSATAAPAATPVSVATSGSDKVLSGNVAAGIKWILTKDGSNYTFKSNSDNDNFLWVYSNNNGVRISDSIGQDGGSSTFVLDETGYLKAVVKKSGNDENRFLCVYNAQDWRCYNNTTGTNIKSQTFSFFVKK